MSNNSFDKSTIQQRRRFLKCLMVGAASMGLSFSLKAKSTANGLVYKTIPGSGEKLPVIGMGTSRTFDLGHDMGYDKSGYDNLLQVMHAFFDGGGALVDSSPMYGSAEKVLGTLIKQFPDGQPLFAATKVWIDGKQAGVEQMEQSRVLWGIKRFDLMQIHNLRDWNIHLETLKQMKADGKIRYIGITTSHGRYHEQLETILQKERFDFVQFSYNIEDREVEKRLLPLASERGTGVIINRPFQRGSLFSRVRGEKVPPWAAEFGCSSWGQFFLKFIVSHPAVTCAIPATTKVHHMKDNMQAGIGVLPDAKTRNRMISFYRDL